MEILNKYILLVFAGSLAIAFIGCESRRTADETNEVTIDTAEPGDTAMVVRSGETAEQKVERLRGWLNRKASGADTSIRENWPETRERIRDINADIEQNFDSLSTKSQEEYRQLKERYAQWEAEQEHRQQQPLHPEQISSWEDQLLREYKNINAITPQNVREAYLTFMGSVRAKKSNYSQNDWDYVDHVYSKLNQRRRQIEGQMSTTDKLKIRALQAEYLALEGAADTQSMLRGGE